MGLLWSISSISFILHILHFRFSTRKGAMAQGPNAHRASFVTQNLDLTQPRRSQRWVERGQEADAVRCDRNPHAVQPPGAAPDRLQSVHVRLKVNQLLSVADPRG